MATTPLWQQLKQLITFDEKRDQIEEKIVHVKKKIEEDKKIIPQLETAIKEIEQASLTAKKNVDFQELNAQELRAREQEKKAALDNVKNQKEYTAAERELESLLKQIAQQEDAVVTAWHQYDLSQQKEKADLIQLKQKITDLQNEIAEKETEIKQFESDLETIKAEKQTHTATIPPEWLERYEKMIQRVPDPIVPVLNASCSACFYSVPPQDMARLKREAILPCRSCYRFLYYDQAEEKDLKTESY